MPHSEHLPDEVLATIARQVGDHVYEVADDDLSGTATVELTETLAVWRLEAERIWAWSGDADVSQLATSTGRSHLQVKVDGRAVLFARSAPLDEDPESWRHRELF